MIGTALATKADWLVTGDRLWLSVAEYQDVQIITVAEELPALAAKG